MDVDVQEIYIDGRYTAIAVYNLNTVKPLL